MKSPSSNLVHCIAISVVILLGAPVRAEAADDEEYDIGSVEVVGAGASNGVTARQLPSDISYAGTIIDVEAYQNRFIELKELLRGVPGVVVREQAGTLSQTSVSIRGSTSDQVLVLLDGVPLNLAAGGSVDLSNIPASSIEKIEVYRGSAPVRYGDAGVGGTINLVTYKDGRGARDRLSGSIASFETTRAQSLTMDSENEFRYLVFAGFTRTKGDFEYRSDNATPQNPDDDSDEERGNNDGLERNLLASAGYYPQENFGFDLTFDLYRKDKNLPGPEAFQASRARLETDRHSVSFRFRGDDLSDGFFTFDLRSHYTVEKHFFADPLSEIGLGAQDNSDRSFSHSHSGYADFKIPGDDGGYVSYVQPSAYVGYEYDGFRSIDERRAPERTDLSHRSRMLYAMELKGAFLDERVILMRSVRIRRVTDRFDGESLYRSVLSNVDSSETRSTFAFNLGVNALAIDGLFEENVVVGAKANINRNSRLPSFSELFGDRGTAVGNSALQSEVSRGWDAGGYIDYEGEGLVTNVHFEATYFHVQTNDQIVFTSNSQNVARAENFLRTGNTGVEIELGTVFIFGTSLLASYTHQDAVNLARTAGLYRRRLPGRPDRTASVNIEHKFEVGEWFTAKPFYSLHYQGKSYLDSVNNQPLPSRSLHGAGVTLRLGESFNMTLEAKNIRGDRHFDSVGYPLPGRSFAFTMQADF
ncbi:MAG: TonB-dependent receptor plug domain-containing protein [Planctomycetes bacterium]|nr:TonB-dependent receptor plug domain-containing protein [Planctomycetota bacterium]